MVTEDIWGSVVVLCQGIIADARILYPGVTIEFIDWETHANVNELPNCDLIGPTSLAITEHSPDLIEISFAVATSTYADDSNLFRHRKLIALAFERMKAERQMVLYSAESALEKGTFVFTNGTSMVPMTRTESRPWQYVQAQGLLLPLSEV